MKNFLEKTINVCKNTNLSKVTTVLAFTGAAMDIVTKVNSFINRKKIQQELARSIAENIVDVVTEVLTDSEENTEENK